MVDLQGALWALLWGATSEWPSECGCNHACSDLDEVQGSACGACAKVLTFAATARKNPAAKGWFFGGLAGARTLDPLIKSQLLYQLSYKSMENIKLLRRPGFGPRGEWVP